MPSRPTRCTLVLATGEIEWASGLADRQIQFCTLSSPGSTAKLIKVRSPSNRGRHSLRAEGKESQSMTTAKFDREQPQRYVRYGRMSTECENPRSIDQQFDSIKLSRQMRDGVEWTHVGDFRDEGLSGRNPLKRPALRQLMEEIRSGQLRIDAILVDSGCRRWCCHRRQPRAS